MIEYPLLSLQELYEVKFCVSLGPLRGKPQDGVKCARDLLWEMLVKKNVKRTRRGLGEPSDCSACLTLAKDIGKE